MPRPLPRPKSTRTILAESLEAQRVINRGLAKIDLRSESALLRQPVKEARKAGAEAEHYLTEALQHDAQAIRATA